MFTETPDIKIYFQSEHTKKVWCDEDAITRAFTNIIFNGMQALGSKRQDRVFVKSSDLIGEVLIELTNTGSFIPPSEIENIFEQFRSFNKPTGNGLGLAIAKDSVDLCGGKIWCTSDLHAQTTSFFITLKSTENLDEHPIKPLRCSKEYLDDFYGVSFDEFD